MHTYAAWREREHARAPRDPAGGKREARLGGTDSLTLTLALALALTV